MCGVGSRGWFLCRIGEGDSVEEAIKYYWLSIGRRLCMVEAEFSFLSVRPFLGGVLFFSLSNLCLAFDEFIRRPSVYEAYYNKMLGHADDIDFLRKVYFVACFRFDLSIGI